MALTFGLGDPRTEQLVRYEREIDRTHSFGRKTPLPERPTHRALQAFFRVVVDSSMKRELLGTKPPAQSLLAVELTVASEFTCSLPSTTAPETRRCVGVGHVVYQVAGVVVEQTKSCCGCGGGAAQVRHRSTANMAQPGPQRSRSRGSNRGSSRGAPRHRPNHAPSPPRCSSLLESPPRCSSPLESPPRSPRSRISSLWPPCESPEPRQHPGSSRGRPPSSNASPPSPSRRSSSPERASPEPPEHESLGAPRSSSRSSSSASPPRFPGTSPAQPPGRAHPS